MVIGSNNNFINASKNTLYVAATFAGGAGVTILAGHVYRYIYMNYLKQHVGPAHLSPDPRLTTANWLQKKLIANTQLFSGLGLYGPVIVGYVAAFFLARNLPIAPLSADYWAQMPEQYRDKALYGRPCFYLVGFFGPLAGLAFVPRIGL